jgi:hypothetical protein
MAGVPLKLTGCNAAGGRENNAAASICIRDICLLRSCIQIDVGLAIGGGAGWRGGGCAPKGWVGSTGLIGHVGCAGVSRNGWVCAPFRACMQE